MRPKSHVPKSIDAWQALIKACTAGKVRAIGFSNFTAEHLQELTDESVLCLC